MSAPLNLPLARWGVDRSSHLRSDSAEVTRIFNSQSTMCLLLDGDSALANTQSLSLRLLPLGALQELGVVANEPGDALEPLAYLGKTLQDQDGVAAGTQIVLVDLNETAVASLNQGLGSSGAEWLQVRRSGFGLSDRDAGLVTQALALANWHRSHVFCSRCGETSLPSQGGWSRTCTACAAEVFPRNDPAIIVVITDDEDRILLGSQGAWEANRWSILAGFVDAGETLNAAVEREMLEESGLRVTDIEYVGSQPWPYPFSLMLGFKARAKGEQRLNPDGVEIEKLRWFSREQLAAESASLLLPGKSTISRAMIEHWFGAPLKDQTEAQR